MDYTAFNFLCDILPLEIIHVIDDYLVKDYRQENAKKISNLMKAVRRIWDTIFYDEILLQYRSCNCGELFSEKYINSRFIRTSHAHCRY
nr:hypothetical protein K-LCC10_0307 [Kaumoebavirus]